MQPPLRPLDTVFHSLANPTRRAVVERLGQGPATVSELAEPFSMALPSFMQHLRILEESGIVRSEKHGRVRTINIVPDRMQPVADWLVHQRLLWGRRLDQFDAYVTELGDST